MQDTTTAPEQHHVVAVMANGRKVRCSAPLPWATAQGMWVQLDDARRAGRMPHVRYYAVRGTDDPAWKGLGPVHQLALCPVAARARNTAQLTSHQRSTLERLARRSDQLHAQDGWVSEAGVGSAGALAHLHRKGYAELDERRGPRGGVHNYYRPSLDGLDYLARRMARAAA